MVVLLSLQEARAQVDSISRSEYDAFKSRTVAETFLSETPIVLQTPLLGEIFLVFTDDDSAVKSTPFASG